jgi:hypothetical protein
MVRRVLSLPTTPASISGVYLTQTSFGGGLNVQTYKTVLHVLGKGARDTAGALALGHTTRDTRRAHRASARVTTPNDADKKYQASIACAMFLIGTLTPDVVVYEYGNSEYIRCDLDHKHCRLSFTQPYSISTLATLVLLRQRNRSQHLNSTMRCCGYHYAPVSPPLAAVEVEEDAGHSLRRVEPCVRVQIF